MPFQNSQLGKYETAASRWASVGPYYAMFPLKFASEAVETHTRRGQIVLDPFAGRATSLFAAVATGRRAYGVEINPVGWIYGKAKLQPASQAAVERRLSQISKRAPEFRQKAESLPQFFKLCFCREVREFLVAARDLLNWRRSKVDWTTMALLLIDLHGKRENALSNQMRQTKALSPQYAVDWWHEHRLRAPRRNPLEFMLKKVAWRYAKGTLHPVDGRLLLGDSRSKLRSLAPATNSKKASLLLTSPPYFGVTNYFYDQWLRFWLLGGPNRPQRTGNDCKGKFANKASYKSILFDVFSKASTLLKRSAVICVRTDSRDFTREATIEALERSFPQKRIRSLNYSQPAFTQTTLFDSDAQLEAETDFVMW